MKEADMRTTPTTKIATRLILAAAAALALSACTASTSAHTPGTLPDPSQLTIAEKTAKQSMHEISLEEYKSQTGEEWNKAREAWDGHALYITQITQKEDPPGTPAKTTETTKTIINPDGSSTMERTRYVTPKPETAKYIMPAGQEAWLSNNEGTTWTRMKQTPRPELDQYKGSFYPIQSTGDQYTYYAGRRTEPGLETVNDRLAPTRVTGA